MICEHLYSRQIDQPYPRHCLKCGEVEPTAEGGDASCPGIQPQLSKAAPNVQSAGCGIPEWSGRDDDPPYYTDEHGVDRWKAGLGKVKRKVTYEEALLQTNNALKDRRGT